MNAYVDLSSADNPAYTRTSIGSRRALAILILISTVLAGLHALFPFSAFAWSDEAAYVSTAYKIARTKTFTAATHLPEDIAKYGTDHAPVHKPVYMLALAIWLSVIDDPESVVWLNRALYVLAIWLITLGLVHGKTSRVETALVAMCLTTFPLGLAYAATAMMESMVLFVGAVVVLAWLRWRHHLCSLFFLTGLAAVGYLTRQTLVLLPLAIVAADWRQMLVLGRRAHKKPWIAASCLLWPPVLIFLIGMFGDRAGYYPNFLFTLDSTPGLANKAGLIATNLGNNLSHLLSLGELPHDLYYLFEMGWLATTVFVTWRMRGTAHKIFARAVLFFGLSVTAALLLFYDNFLWRGHRVLSLCLLLALALFLGWLLNPDFDRRLKSVLMLGVLAANIVLAVVTVRYFGKVRQRTSTVHPLTAAAILSPGDLVFSHLDFQFLLENPHCELMWKLPASRQKLAALVDRAHPRFIITPLVYSWRDRGYQVFRTQHDRHIWVREP